MIVPFWTHPVVDPLSPHDLCFCKRHSTLLDYCCKPREVSGSRLSFSVHVANELTHCYACTNTHYTHTHTHTHRHRLVSISSARSHGQRRGSRINDQKKTSPPTQWHTYLDILRELLTPYGICKRRDKFKVMNRRRSEIIQT